MLIDFTGPQSIDLDHCPPKENTPKTHWKQNMNPLRNSGRGQIVALAVREGSVAVSEVELAANTEQANQKRYVEKHKSNHS